jgi:LysM repeat protein
MASSASVRKIATYLIGFGVTAVASVMILAWAFKSGLPILTELFASNPATAAINDAGLRITGALDSASSSTVPGTDSGTASFTLAGFSAGGELPILPLPAIGGQGNGVTVAPLAPAIAAPLPTATPVRSTVLPVANDHDWAGYTVRPGDSMGSIARRYGVSLGDLCGMNTQVTRGNCNLIRAGMQLKLPATNGDAPRELPQVAKPVYQTVSNTLVAVQPTAAPVVRQTAQAGGQTYAIRPGDTIYSIASRFGGLGRVYAICGANRAVLGDNCDLFQAGAVIVIP